MNSSSLAPRVFIDRLLEGDPQELRALVLANPSLEQFKKLSKLSTKTDETLVSSGESAYVGAAPKLYLNSELSPAVVAYGLWLFARSVYLELTHDRADLSAWLDNGLPFSLEKTSRVQMLKLKTTGSSIPVNSVAKTVGVVHF